MPISVHTQCAGLKMEFAYSPPPPHPFPFHAVIKNCGHSIKCMCSVVSALIPTPAETGGNTHFNFVSVHSALKSSATLYLIHPKLMQAIISSIWHYGSMTHTNYNNTSHHLHEGDPVRQKWKSRAFK